MTEFKVDNDKLVDVIIPEAMSQREFESLDHDDQIDEILEPKNVTENYLDGIRNGVERVISKGVPLPMPMEDLELIIRNVEITKAELSKLINKHPNSKILLHQLVNRAVILGTLVGAQRGRVIFDDHIKRAENNKNNTKIGGKKRAEQKKNRNAELRKRAREEAARLWETHTTLNLTNMAIKVLSETGIQGLESSTVETYIRDLNPKARNKTRQSS